MQLSLMKNHTKKKREKGMYVSTQGKINSVYSVNGEMTLSSCSSCCVVSFLQRAPSIPMATRPSSRGNHGDPAFHVWDAFISAHKLMEAVPVCLFQMHLGFSHAAAACNQSQLSIHPSCTCEMKWEGREWIVLRSLRAALTQTYIFIHRFVKVEGYVWNKVNDFFIVIYSIFDVFKEPLISHTKITNKSKCHLSLNDVSLPLQKRLFSRIMQKLLNQFPWNFVESGAEWQSLFCFYNFVDLSENNSWILMSHV